MRFSVLGPVHVEGAGGALEIRGTLRRTLLAALLLNADTVVSGDRLTDYLWGDEPPASATAPLYNQLMRLRQALEEGGDRIKAVPPGSYLIQVEPGELDLHVFAQRREAGSRALAEADWIAAEKEFTAALELWRGEPLADVPALADHPAVRRLEEDRLQVKGGLIEARLHLGRHDEVIEDLITLTAAYPLHESFHGQLMLALYRAGRRAEALDTYLALRRALVDERGVEPSAEISVLHKRIHEFDEQLLRVTPPATEAPEATGAASSLGGRARRQLPADTRLFTGRITELDELLALTTAAATGTAAGTAVISALNGMAGVGKSALAIHAAHRVAAAFPDGQLFVDLRGHTAGLEPRRPIDALHHLLRSLDVPPQMIPEDLDKCSALFRDRLAGSKTLIVLDDAAAAEQVRPLLPTDPGCFALITSRAMLTGLDDAHSINLGVLDESAAMTLLRKVAGPERVAAEDSALTELVELCGRMPLALRIAGARLRHFRQLGVADLVLRLRDESERLEHLSDEDRNLTALFDTSFADLSPDEQRTFLLLGLIPGPDADAYAAANLLGSDLRTAETLLASLLEHNLLLQLTPGRYRLHDLLRAYARSRHAETSVADSDAAIARLLDYYQFTASSADKLISPRPELRVNVFPGLTADPVPELTSEDLAYGWFNEERANLFAAAESDTTAPERRIFLTTKLALFLKNQWPWSIASELHETAVTLARAIGDSEAEGEALLILAENQLASGQVEVGLETTRSALTIFQQLKHPLGIADATEVLSYGLVHNGEFASSAEYAETALALHRELGNRFGIANCLLNLGRIKQMVTDPTAGAELLEEALSLFAEVGSHMGAAVANGELARGAFKAGRFREASDRSSQAVVFFQKTGQRRNEAVAIMDVSRARMAVGEFEEAIRLQERGLDLCREIGFPHGVALGLYTRGRVMTAAGDPAAAAEAQAEALRMYVDFGDRHAQACMRSDLGASKHVLGDRDTALELVEQARQTFREYEDLESEAEAVIHLAELAEDMAGPQQALEKYRQALEMLASVHNPSNVAYALERIARCLAPTDLDAALTNIRESAALYREMGAWETARAEAYLAELEGRAQPTS